MTTLVLHNPLAGGGRSAHVWQKLSRDVPELAGMETVRAGSALGLVDALVQRMAAGDVERVLSVGGDGTAHLMVNGLLRAGRGDVPMGVVPAGTASDFARHVGLPRDAETALRRALAVDPAEARPIDAIEVTVDGAAGPGTGTSPRYCLNIASAGLSGAVNQAVARSRERGGGSYLAATLATLLRYGAVSCRIEVDGEPFHDGLMYLVAMANCSSFGNDMRVAPDAVVDDGLLDVVLVPPIPKWQLPIRLPQFLTGRHVRLDQVTVRRATSVHVDPGPGFPPFDLDGESLEPVPATFRVLPAALRLLA